MSGASKQGNDIYDLLINLILDLTPKQAGSLYSDLLSRFKKSSRTKRYNENGELDPNGKVRLMESQFNAIRAKFGMSYVKKAFYELSEYIKYLEEHLGTSPEFKSKLRTYESKTHNNILTEGWVFRKCKQYISVEKPKINVNPFEIEDYPTAVEYLKSIPKSTWDTALDVKMLIMKFPQIVDDIKEHNQ